MKHILKVIGIGLGRGLELLFFKQALHIPEEIFMKCYWIFGAGAIVAVVLFNILYIRSYQRKMYAAALLLEQGKTKEYIQVVEELCQKAKGRYLQYLFTLNLSAGYCDLKEYNKATELLKSLENVRLHQDLKLVYHINLCICYFMTSRLKRYWRSMKTSKSCFALPLE